MNDEKLDSAVKEIRRALQAEGGDMELVDLTDEGVAKVRILGKSTCGVCPRSAEKLPINVGKILKKRVPKIKKVELFRKCP